MATIVHASMNNVSYFTLHVTFVDFLPFLLVFYLRECEECTGVIVDCSESLKKINGYFEDSKMRNNMLEDDLSKQRKINSDIFDKGKKQFSVLTNEVVALQMQLNKLQQQITQISRDWEEAMDQR